MGLLGVWRSLVARSVRVGEVPSSNLGTPISSLLRGRLPIGGALFSIRLRLSCGGARLLTYRLRATHGRR